MNIFLDFGPFSARKPENRVRFLSSPRNFPKKRSFAPPIARETIKNFDKTNATFSPFSSNFQTFWRYDTFLRRSLYPQQGVIHIF